MKRLIFTDYEGFKKLKISDREDAILIDYPPSENLDIEIKNLEKFNIEEFFPEKLLHKSEEQAKLLHKRFYDIVDKNVIYKKIDLFELIRKTFLSHIIQTISYIDIFDYIIINKKPDKILVISKEKLRKNINFIEDSSLWLRVLQEVASLHKIPLEFKFLKTKKKIDNKNIFRNMLLNLLGKLQNLYYKYTINFKKKKAILFVGGKDAFISVMNQLRNKVTMVRCGINPANSFFSKDQDYYITFGNSPKRNFDRYLNKILDKISSLEYKKILLVNILNPNINYLCSNYFGVLARWIDLAYEIEPKIKKAIMTNDLIEFEKVFIRILQSKKKPCYVIQHGITTYKEGWLPLIADKMFVWGKTSKKWFLDCNVKNNKLIVTGSPKYDDYFNSYKDINIRKDLNIPKNKKIVFYAAEPSKEWKFPSIHLLEKERIKIFRSIFKTFKNMKDYFLLIKLHPSDQDTNTPRIIAREEGIKNYRLLEKTYPIFNLLYGSDLVMAIYSTALIEAMILRKPTLVINFFDKRQVTPYLKYKVSSEAKNEKELKKQIIKTIKNKDKIVSKSDKFIKQYFLNTDGKAAERIAKVILE